MSEQKYYVKSLLEQNSKYDLWLDSVGTFDYTDLRKSYTKSELAEIKDGAFYKKAAYCEFMELPPDWEMRDEKDKWLCEWINPLIELVPVEEK
ncbi:hypothetical protein [Lactococcus petauri]|uniref:hypothetical protein n=1 Tax=Lactococcus petauri TaxID=1940789 RepID=UPI0031FEC1BE